LNQPVTADPTSSLQVRRRIKFYKALYGPDQPVFADHVELTDTGADFASEIGAGGVPGTKFIWQPGPETLARLREVWALDETQRAEWRKWFQLYNAHRPAQGEYLNLYDLAFDHPEGHVLRKGERYYYGFFAEQYQGPIELRGLAPQRYRVRDYVNEQDYGVVEGPVARLNVNFRHALLLLVEPLDRAGVDSEA